MPGFETVFQAPVQTQAEKGLTTVKVRNLVGKYTLERIVKELIDFEVSFVRFFPRQGPVRSYAFVDFASAAQALQFIEVVREAHGTKGSTIATGLLNKRDALFGKIQGSEELLAAYGKLPTAEENTWSA
jgi:hypothetical protein